MGISLGHQQRPTPGSGLLISNESQDSAAVYGETVVDKSKLATDSATITVPKHINLPYQHICININVNCVEQLSKYVTCLKLHYLLN
jgi:hypothetical protein